ncbi:MAG: hypothetical protein ACM3JI_04910, partial [Anaerolineae bacterium]
KNPLKKIAKELTNLKNLSRISFLEAPLEEIAPELFNFIPFRKGYTDLLNQCLEAKDMKLASNYLAKIPQSIKKQVVNIHLNRVMDNTDGYHQTTIKHDKRNRNVELLNEDLEENELLQSLFLNRRDLLFEEYLQQVLAENRYSELKKMCESSIFSHEVVWRMIKPKLDLLKIAGCVNPGLFNDKSFKKDSVQDFTSPSFTDFAFLFEHYERFLEMYEQAKTFFHLPQKLSSS